MPPRININVSEDMYKAIKKQAKNRGATMSGGYTACPGGMAGKSKRKRVIGKSRNTRRRTGKGNG